MANFFLNVWHMTQNAPWPTYPAEAIKLAEVMFAMIDKGLKEGGTLEFGYFPNGASGYAIFSRETKNQLGRVFSFYPWIINEVREMVPYEKEGIP